METFIQTITDSLTLSSIAYIEKFDGIHNYLVLGSSSKLYFYIFENDTPTYRFCYQIFGDIALIIPHNCDGIPILVVILYSTKFCVLHYENGQILTDQNGELTASTGFEVCQRYSYSIFKSVLLLQLWQEGLQLYKIEKKKMIFIQNIFFYSTIITRFQLISSKEFIVLVKHFDLTFSFEHHVFDLLSCKQTSQVTLPKSFSNFIHLKDKDLLMSQKGFIYQNEKSFVNYLSLNLNEFIFDIFLLESDFFLAVTISGKILTIKKIDVNNVQISTVGEVIKPLKPIIIGRNQFVLPSKSGEVKYFTLNGLKTLFTFSGRVKKFIEMSNRCFLGLTTTNHVYRIEKTLFLDDLCEFQFDLRNRCWFIDENQVLFSIEKNTKILNIRDQSENIEFPIQRNDETIGFQRIDDHCYIQITKQFVFINNEPLNTTFSNISLSTFSETSFAICENLTQLFLVSFEGNIQYYENFPFQINSIALFKNILLAISSWISSSVLIFRINYNEDGECSIELIYEFKNLPIIDISFIDNGEIICALSPKDEVHFLSLSTFSMHSIQCEGIHYKLSNISMNEILISGEKSFVIKDKILTEIENDKSFLYNDCYDDLFLFCNTDNSLSIKRRKRNYKFKFTDVSFPMEILDVAQYDTNTNAVLFRDSQNETKIAITENVLNFDSYKIDSQNHFEKCKLACLIRVKDNISNSIYIVASGGLELFSLSLDSSNQFVKKSSFNFNTKLVGLSIIENNIFCLILADQIISFSLEEGAIIKKSSVDTAGATNCFSYLNRKLIIGDCIGSFVIYEYQNNLFSEIYRECHELDSSSCLFINDDTMLGADKNSFFYQIKTSQEKNLASKNLVIEKVCSTGSQIKSMIYCKNLNCVLASDLNGQIIECKQINCPEFFNDIFNKIENSLNSVGGFENASFRKCICMGYYIGIPRIYDANILQLFMEIDQNQKEKIAEKCNFNLNDVEFILNEVLDSF